MNKKYMIFLLFCIGNLMMCQQIFAQEIKIGERMPALTLENVYGSDKTGSLRLFDTKPKLTILDFWGHACKGCLESFPYLDSLQKQFAGKVQLVLVNAEGLDSTKRFLEQRKHLLTKPDIPMVTDDTLLSKFFPHLSFPFYVWIDSTGIVRYQTGSEGLSADNISRFLNNEELNMSEYIGRLNYLPSLFTNDLYGSLISFSYLAHASQGISIGTDRNPENFPGDLCFNYVSASELFRFAYEEYDKYNFRRIGRFILEMKDSFPYVKPRDKNKVSEWRKQFEYTYDLRVPASLMEQKYKVMQQELDRYFKIQASVETRPLKALTLIRTSGRDKLKSKGGKPKDTFNYYSSAEKSLPIRQLINQPYDKFSNKLCRAVEHRLAIPFYDETGYIGNIDIQVEDVVLDFMDLDLLNNALATYDLKLVEKDVMLEVLVLKDK